MKNFSLNIFLMSMQSFPHAPEVFFEGADRDADRMAECGQPAENVFSRA